MDRGTLDQLFYQNQNGRIVRLWTTLKYLNSLLFELLRNRIIIIGIAVTIKFSMQRKLYLNSLLRKIKELVQNVGSLIY